mgnify:FL=1
MTVTSALPNKTALEGLDAAMKEAARAVPPLWPLSSSVAVNPFLGQADKGLAGTGALLGKTAGIKVTMARSWYEAEIAKGAILDEDLEAALAASPHAGRPADIAALKRAVQAEMPVPAALPTIAGLAADASGTDWPGLAAERIGAWAGAYFDEGQALWALPRKERAYASWRAAATYDLVPEILGLRGFAAHVADAPQRPLEAATRALATLQVSEAARPLYFQRLLMELGGWAQAARYRLWQAELEGGADETLCDLLIIRLVWEEALYLLHQKQIAPAWQEALAEYEKAPQVTPGLIADEILQEAAERAGQRRLATQLLSGGNFAEQKDTQVPLHAAFCIDVRSEVFRRALETAYPGARTSGFAGFFGLPAAHHALASDIEEKRLPVLLSPALHSSAVGEKEKETDLRARLLARASRAWGRFKMAAVSSFAFVEATGPLYVGKLFRDGLGGGVAHRVPDPAPKFAPALDLAARAALGESVLRAMSMTKDFARLVLLAGHGASARNNPHASALHCGACGGYAGDVNARLLASLLNDPPVRAELVQRGIVIPSQTLFLAALHDTTKDEVTLFDQDVPAAGLAKEIALLRSAIEKAGLLARAERAQRLPGAKTPGDVATRSYNWAEVRPEWGLAGCKAFIAAPRARTHGLDLSGEAFLHEYDWHADKEFSVLELIMTAPVVVASWISLQYYGSAVAPSVFGAGNKLLHNVTGGMGVLEGSTGPLRAGLPWQSVHDGEKLMHRPLRLSICIEAPKEAMTEILARNGEVRALFDNKWLHLFAMDEEGRLAARYAGDLTWADEPLPGKGAEDPVFLSAAE